MTSRRFAVALALLLAPTFAAASDLPVTYTVEEKPLKAAVAGTPLTFTLHRNASCADAPVTTVVWPIEGVTFISRLKMFTPKNATKIPNTAELHHMLYAVIATGPLYLKVVGTGITPVGGLCQLQSAQVRDLVPPLTMVLHYGFNNSGKWGVEDPGAVGLPNPTDILAVDESVGWFLDNVNETPGARYSCALRLRVNNGVVGAGGLNYVPVFGIDVCTVCSNPYPGCL